MLRDFLTLPSRVLVQARVLVLLSYMKNLLVILSLVGRVYLLFPWFQRVTVVPRMSCVGVNWTCGGSGADVDGVSI